MNSRYRPGKTVEQLPIRPCGTLRSQGTGDEQTTSLTGAFFSKKRLPLQLLLCLLLWFLPASGGAADLPQTATLTLKISNIKAVATGQLRIALFRGEPSWPKFSNALQIQTHPAVARELQISFMQLPYADDYAIEIHHDENGNGKFDMRWFPYPRPKEGVGVSNNRFGFGHPDFSDARFSINRAQTAIAIEMKY